MKDTTVVPASDSRADEAVFKGICILGLDSNDGPVVEGQYTKQMLAFYEVSLVIQALSHDAHALLILENYQCVSRRHETSSCVMMLKPQPVDEAVPVLRVIH